MAITKRQFSQLQAMGIGLWQLKNSGDDNKTTTVAEFEVAVPAFIETRLFLDILHSLGLSIGEVICQNNSLSLGLFTWKFSEQADISFTHQHLVTPSIDVLQYSPKLKQKLWQTLQEHSLI